ncbi:hypothetical protein ACLOJK_018925 [Asimina triloba]
MHVYTTGAPRYGAPSSPRDCHPTQLRRGSDRPIGPIQTNGDSVFIPDPARLWSISDASCPSKRAADGRNRTMMDCLPSISNACPPFTKQHPDQQQNNVPRPDLASTSDAHLQSIQQSPPPVITHGNATQSVQPLSNPTSTKPRSDDQQLLTNPVARPIIQHRPSLNGKPKSAPTLSSNPFDHGSVGQATKKICHSTLEKSTVRKPIRSQIQKPSKGIISISESNLDHPTAAKKITSKQHHDLRPAATNPDHTGQSSAARPPAKWAMAARRQQRETHHAQISMDSEVASDHQHHRPGPHHHSVPKSASKVQNMDTVGHHSDHQFSSERKTESASIQTEIRQMRQRTHSIGHSSSKII